ncbi:Replication protein E1, partial [Bienertia sinuspersici]
RSSFIVIVHVCIQLQDTSMVIVYLIDYFCTVGKNVSSRSLSFLIIPLTLLSNGIGLYMYL